MSRFITSLSKVKANSLNLAGTYGFSGTVSGLADETPLVLISTFTSDGSDATATFTSGIDSTYKEYLFVLNDMHPATDGTALTFNGSTDTANSGFTGVNITSSWFASRHTEDDGTTSLSYNTGKDLAQSNAFQQFTFSGNANDESSSGIIHLFNPSSTTFVKHFIARGSATNDSDDANDIFLAGYLNTTSAIDAIQFKMSSGEIQGGTIDLFGVV